MRTMLKILAAAVCLGAAGPAQDVAAHGPMPGVVAGDAVAAAAAGRPPVLFRGVRVFDGRSGRVSPAQDVLVRGNRIERIGPALAAEP